MYLIMNWMLPYHKLVNRIGKGSETITKARGFRGQEKSVHSTPLLTYAMHITFISNALIFSLLFSLHMLCI